MDWEGVEANVGGGITPAADFKYTAEKKELEIDLNSPLYAFCDFKLNTLFGTQLEWGVKRNLVTWHLWDTKITLTDDTPTTDGIEINGVIWATCNVNAPGTFAANPEDAGMFYQWNSKIGWSNTDPLIASNGSARWDSNWNGNNATVWESANDPCPDGWRVPTKDEFESLANASKERVTINDVDGLKFGIGNNTIFLPAVGRREYYNRLDREASFYWSATYSDSSGLDNHSFAEFINRSSSSLSLYHSFRPSGFSIRCVKKESNGGSGGGSW
jgi:uncharacterized protein (TIGR02145 family)